MSTTAKLFWSGRSQAVRLPKEFRIDGKEVNIRRQGNLTILEPVTKKDGWDWLRNFSGSLDDDCIAAALEEVPMPPDKPELEDL